MVRIYPGDFLGIEYSDRYYYALVISKITYFGGNWVYVFHFSSSKIRTAEEVLRRSKGGFHAFVDFIVAKRESRVTRVATKLDTSPYDTVTRLKATPTPKGKAKLWGICNMKFRWIDSVKKLSKEQKRYPLCECIDDTLMVRHIKKKWVPESDPQI